MIDSRKLFLAFLVFWALSGILNKFLPQEIKKEVTPADFKLVLQEDKFKELTFYPEVINGKLKNPVNGFTVFYTRPVTILEREAIRDLAEKQKVPYRGAADTSFLWGVASNFLFMVLLWFLLVAMLRGQTRGMQDFSKSKARLYNAKNKKVTFADVAGCDGAKEELREIVEFLKNPLKFQRLGGRIPKGLLLYGQPGTGKTLLAKAVAGEANVSFFSGSGSEFVEMFVGVGATRVRDLFNQARKNRPAVIFIDELDAVGRHRFAGIGGGHDEREQTLNQILVELDGFDTEEGIILIAATNRPDVLDPALLRPGRFDRQVQVPTPDVRGRQQILKVHARGKIFAGEVDLSVIARQTPGFTGADLANLLNEAALLAARSDKDAISQVELEEAIQRVIAGTERRVRLISENEKKIIAYHEAGHTLVAKLTPGADPVHRVTIVSRGQALGYTLQLPLEDKVLHSKKELLDKVGILLGGRIAEELQFKEITGGACNDLENVTKLVRNMITKFGMGKKLSVFSAEEVANRLMQGQDTPRYSQHYLKEIDLEVEEVIQGVKKQITELLQENMQKLTALADALLAEETLNAERIDEVLSLT